METTEKFNYSIRQAILTDLDRIIEIWKCGLGNAFGTTTMSLKTQEYLIEQEFEKNISSQTDVFKFWVFINQENDVIAWCSVLPVHPNPLLHNSWGIISLYVDEKYQNKLYGYMLAKYALADASKTTLRYIISIVSSDNERVVKLSRKMGFSSLGVLPKNVIDNELSLTEMMIYEA